LYELAVTGAFVGFGDALAALSDAYPAELTFLHPQSVRYFFSIGYGIPLWKPLLFFIMSSCM
jgi:hypothetical protein